MTLAIKEIGVSNSPCCPVFDGWIGSVLPTLIFPVSRQPILVPLSEVFLSGGVCYDNGL